MALVVLLATVLVVMGTGLLVRRAQKGPDYTLEELGKDLAYMGRFSSVHVRYFMRYSWKVRQQLLMGLFQQEEEELRAAQVARTEETAAPTQPLQDVA